MWLEAMPSLLQARPRDHLRPRSEAMAPRRWPYPLTSSAAREWEGGESELQLSSALNGRLKRQRTTHWSTDRIELCGVVAISDGFGHPCEGEAGAR